MAAVKSLRGVQLLIKVGDGDEDDETFAAKCSINAARGIQFSASTNDQNIPDCSDPDLIAWAAREKVTLSASISGAGMLNTPDVAAFAAWFASPDPKNIQVHLGTVVLADGGGHWAGAFHLTDFQITGDRGARTEFTCTLQSDGVVAFTPAAA